MKATRRAQALVAGIVVTGGLVAGTGIAPAAVGSFEGSANATGVRMIFFADKAPATKTPVDGGGPVAQAALDSLGTSFALASNPYPGDVFLAGPGLAAGAFGAPSAPPYPFIARADHPVTPEQKASTPFGDFAASATERAARAAATTSGSQDFSIGRAVSGAGVRVDGDLVVAESESTAQAVRIGKLTIGAVHSTAKVVLKPDGTLERTAQVAFENATVAGAPVAFTPEGVVPAPGFKAPRGAMPADELAGSGIEVVQLAREDTPDGVVAGGLQITKSQDFGPAGPGYIRFVFGQAGARARGEATVLDTPAEPATRAPADAPPVAAPPVAPDAELTTADPAVAVTPIVSSFDAPSTSISAPFRGAPSFSEPTAAGEELATPTPVESTQLASASASAPVAGQVHPARLAVADANRLDVGPIYAVLLLVGLIGGAALRFLRFFAGR